MIETLLVYALLTTSLYYLGSRATLTEPLWSRYPAALARFFDCSACAGTWYGLAVGIAASTVGPATPPGLLSESYSPIVVALCSMVWTPILAGFMQAGFERLGSAVPEDTATDHSPLADTE